MEILTLHGLNLSSRGLFFTVPPNHMRLMITHADFIVGETYLNRTVVGVSAEDVERDLGVQVVPQDGCTGAREPQQDDTKPWKW